MNTNLQSPIDNHPVIVTDTAGYDIQYPTSQDKHQQPITDIDVDQIGSIMNDNDPNDDNIDDDPVVHSLQEAQEVMNKT